MRFLVEHPPWALSCELLEVMKYYWIVAYVDGMAGSTAGQHSSSPTFLGVCGSFFQQAWLALVVG